MKYFDAHCHIQLSEYDEDRFQVLKRMQDAGVGGLVVGVDFKSSENAVELVRAYGATDSNIQMYTAVGLHPNDTDEPYNAEGFEELARQPEVVAIGECGLDYYRTDVSAHPDAKALQKDIFEQQIELAVKYDKPLMIHSRPSKGSQDAYSDTLDMIRSKKREYGDRLKGDMHFFVGGVDEARQFVELDFTMSYTAVITFSSDYDEVIQYVPIANLLSETDSPYVAPAPNRGKRNEPTAVRNVVQRIAEIRREDPEEVRKALLSNSARLFKFPL